LGGVGRGGFSLLPFFGGGERTRDYEGDCLGEGTTWIIMTIKPKENSFLKWAGIQEKRVLQNVSEVLSYKLYIIIGEGFLRAGPGGTSGGVDEEEGRGEASGGRRPLRSGGNRGSREESLATHQESFGMITGL